MANDGVCQNPGFVLDLQFHRCANCGAFVTYDEPLKYPNDSDRGTGLCEACALAQPGTEEFV